MICNVELWKRPFSRRKLSLSSARILVRQLSWSLQGGLCLYSPPPVNPWLNRDLTWPKWQSAKEGQAYIAAAATASSNYVWSDVMSTWSRCWYTWHVFSSRRPMTSVSDVTSPMCDVRSRTAACMTSSVTSLVVRCSLSIIACDSVSSSSPRDISVYKPHDITMTRVFQWCHKYRRLLANYIQLYSPYRQPQWKKEYKEIISKSVTTFAKGTQLIPQLIV